MSERTIRTDHLLMVELRDAAESLMFRRDMFIHSHDEQMKEGHRQRLDQAWRRYEAAWNAVADALAGETPTLEG